MTDYDRTLALTDYT